MHAQVPGFTAPQTSKVSPLRRVARAGASADLHRIGFFDGAGSGPVLPHPHRRAKLRASRLAALVCAACCCLASTLHAQPRAPRDLGVRGATACVNVPSLRRRIAHFLGDELAPPGLAIEVDLVGEPHGFQLMRAGTVIAQRRFERLPAACAERRDAIALTIAVAIEHAVPQRADSDARPARGVEPPPAAENEASAHPTHEPAAPARAPAPSAVASAASTEEGAASTGPSGPGSAAAREADLSRAESSTVAPAAAASDATTLSTPWVRPTERWMIRAGGVYLVQALPFPARALTAGAELALAPPLRLGLAALLSERASGALDRGDVEAQLAGGSATACLNAPISSLLVHACAGVTAAYVHAQGRGFEPPLADQLAWLAGALGAGVEFPATGLLALRLGGTGYVNVLRPELRVDRGPEPPSTRTTGVIGASIAAEILLRVD